MIKTITIGDLPLKNILKEHLLEVALIEGVHLVMNHDGNDFWHRPYILDYSNKMFHDTITMDYRQKRVSDGLEGKTIVLFFNHENLTYHWHFENEGYNQRPTHRLKIQSIKYLIQKGYNIPIY